MNYQTLLSLSQLAIAAGLIISALGGYGAYYFKQKLDEMAATTSTPIVDLCHRGISVRDIGRSTMYFDIPYCAGKNANAHNVKLLAGVFLKTQDGYETLCPFSDEFPDGISLSYEQGKSMNFTLNPLTPDHLPSMLIAVKGSFTGEEKKVKHTVFDVFKYSTVNGSWVRTMGAEDSAARKFINSLPDRCT